MLALSIPPLSPRPPDFFYSNPSHALALTIALPDIFMQHQHEFFSANASLSGILALHKRSIWALSLGILNSVIAKFCPCCQYLPESPQYNLRSIQHLRRYPWAISPADSLMASLAQGYGLDRIGINQSFDQHHPVLPTSTHLAIL